MWKPGGGTRPHRRARQIGGITGRYGNMSSMDPAWTDCKNGTCRVLEAHLYCIQVDA